MGRQARKKNKASRQTKARRHREARRSSGTQSIRPSAEPALTREEPVELLFETRFFSVAPTPVPEEEPNGVPTGLTTEQLRRRLRFRRMVLRLMTALTAFALLAVLLRIAQPG